MISVIVCSYNTSLFNNLAINVAETVGVPFEIIRIDNSTGKYGVCSAYNEGAAKAKYEILCFMHEDIVIKTNQWGGKVAEILASDPALGLIGVAGGSYKTFAPSTWTFSCSTNDTLYINLMQVYKYLERPVRHLYVNPKEEKLSKVVAVDGVWFCTTKSIAQNIRFDEETFRGFHCYDVDFSLSVRTKYDVVVSFEILIEHFSEGKNDGKWIEDVLKLHQKWDHIFPINLDNLSAEVQVSEEKKAYAEFIRTMLNMGYSAPSIVKRLNFNSARIPIKSKDVKELKNFIYSQAAKSMVKRLLNKTKLFKYQV